MTFSLFFDETVLPGELSPGSTNISTTQKVIVGISPSVDLPASPLAFARRLVFLDGGPIGTIGAVVDSFALNSDNVYIPPLGNVAPVVDWFLQIYVLNKSNGGPVRVIALRE